MEPVVEPNEEVQLDFAGPLQDELNRDAYILVAIDKWSKFSTAKVVSNTTADIAIKFMQRYISNNGVPRRIRCDQAQTFRAKKFRIFCNSNNIKLLFALVDDHRAMGVVERMIQTLKHRLAVTRIDKNKHTVTTCFRRSRDNKNFTDHTLRRHKNFTFLSTLRP